ncbi:MAG TPA: hypothetical protein VK601_29475, partial [Kofleriaceae bacterium]|nr:hypothetical protein [Kofleriaceae bacterium]
MALRGLASVLAIGACTAPAGPIIEAIPVTPVGHDAYLRWEELPVIELGGRAYMRSTYDRSGGNAGADASHFLRQSEDGASVTLDVAGTGVLVFARANHWHGSPWRWTIDGVDHVISETSTATPDQPVAGSTFLPADALPEPLAVTWSTTRGADLSWVPVPFTRSLTISYERTHYGTGYYIYHLYPQADDQRATVTAWNEEPPPTAVRELFGRAGTDIAPPGDEHEMTVDVAADGATAELALAGPATVRKLSIDAPVALAAAVAQLRLVVSWDGAAPSIDAPLG